MAVFETVFNILRNIGFFDVFLPLILIWALVYGILLRLKFFTIKQGQSEEVNTKLSSLVAFSIALLAVGSYQILRLLQIILPYIGLVIVTIFSIILVAGFVGGIEYGNITKLKGKWKALLGGGTGLVVFLWLLYVLGYFNPSNASIGTIPPELIESIAGFAMLGGFVLIVWWLSKPERPPVQQQTQQQSS